MTGRPIISEEYRKLQRELHDSRESYGTASLAFAPTIKALIEEHGVQSIADYGAGKCNLRVGLTRLGVTDFDYYPYDPAYPEYGNPRSADLVVCVDVLEHIEEAYLENVLAELATITAGIGYFTIHVGPARKVLPDGRNAHLIQQPSSWWLPRLCSYFEILKLDAAPNGFSVLVERIGRARPPGVVKSSGQVTASSPGLDLFIAARAQAEKRQFADAVQLYAELLQRDPESDEGLRLRGLTVPALRLRFVGCLRKIGDMAGVKRELDLVARSATATPEVLVSAADLAVGYGLVAEADAILQAADDRGVDTTGVRLRRGEMQ